jgi:hypothetical protein
MPGELLLLTAIIGSTLLDAGAAERGCRLWLDESSLLARSAGNAYAHN